MTTLLLSRPGGDIEEPTDGLYFDDTRHLSRWVLTVDGTRPDVLTASGEPPVRYAVLTPPVRRDRPPAYAVFRTQAADLDGFAEELRVVNHTGGVLRLVVGYDVEVDFADQFEVRSGRSYAKPGGVHGAGPGPRFTYRREWFSRDTLIRCEPPPPSDDRLQWTVEVPAGAEWTLRIDIPRGDASAGLRTAPAVAASVTAGLDAFVTAAAPAGTGWPALDQCLRRGLRDLATLRIPMDDLSIVGAGAPWFLTLFGRDSLLTAYFALPYAPDLARDVLIALARTQGTTVDEARTEEPGKIIHEVRAGELAGFGQVPFARIYASVDATPLFLVLLAGYASTVDPGLAVSLEPAARAALGWITGALDRDGYLTYPTDRPGLRNQCWKDSGDSVRFPDGTPAEGPVAVCEAQGYAYDALVRGADLAERCWSDPDLGASLRARAARLRAAVVEDFWIDGYVALALDGRRRPVPAVTSNPGHLLWSGLLDADRAAAVGARLIRPDLFNGWGIRTLSAADPGYHPLSYHNGSVWPHDTAVVVAGLARYGMRDEARTVAEGLVTAASRDGGRLPELIAGYGRDERADPVPYPHSCSPQAWAAAAPLLIATALR